MTHLPQELINEILVRLPVKSLLRFRCVSRSFCDIIGSKSFINSHFKRCSENKIHRKLIDLGTHAVDNNNPPRIHALEFNDDFQQELVLDKPYNNIPPKLQPFCFSYCNGLVLLCPDKFSIWNSSTRQYRTLPDFPVKNTCKLNFALGYDSTKDDYKAVVIISEKEGGFSQVWVFELRSTRWRRIHDFPYVGYGSMEGGGNGDFFVDGSLHFMCYHSDGYKSYIVVAFDVGEETFSLVSPPDIKSVAVCLHVFGGCLSIIYWSMRFKAQVDLYVRKKKDGDGFTWTRLEFASTQELSGEAFGFLAEGRFAYSKEGDKLFLSSNGKLCSYDIEGKNLQEIVIKNTNHLNIFSCTESLVSVGGLRSIRRRRRNENAPERGGRRRRRVLQQ